MALTMLTAIIAGVIGAGAVTANVMGQRQEKKSLKSSMDAAVARQKAIEEAPDKAAAAAKLETMKKRRMRAKTLLTSPKGVLEGESTKKTLLGE